jgi:hypothetical protein
MAGEGRSDGWHLVKKTLTTRVPRYARYNSWLQQTLKSSNHGGVRSEWRQEMSNPITAPALAEHLRDDSKEARLAAFARLNLRSPEDIREFIRNQDAASTARTSMVKAD